MERNRTLLAAGIGAALVALAAPLTGADDYIRALRALEPDHLWRLDEPELGTPRTDDGGDPVPCPSGTLGLEYDSPVEDTGFAPVLIHGNHQGKFAPLDADPVGQVGAAGPFGLCGLEDSNLAFLANNAASIGLGPGEALADDVMTVALWFQANGSDGGDRIFTNNRPTSADHFQLVLGAGANLVIGVNPQGETTSDSLQVPASVVNAKDGQWHHVVASRNGGTTAGLIVVVDGIDCTPLLADSTTGWGVTGEDARIASRPGCDGGSGSPSHMTLNGAVDEVALWLGRQLTVAESQGLYWAALTCIPRGTVTRSFPKSAYRTGDTLDVELTVAVEDSAPAVVVDEVLPAGMAAVDISGGGTLLDFPPEPPSIEWTLAGSGALSYRLVPGPCSGDASFPGGTFTVDGAKGRIGGPAAIVRELPDAAPGDWRIADIGAAAGGHEVLGDHDILVQGSGAGVRLMKDEIHFLHTPASGDFEVSARIDCLDGAAGAARAGLVVRETLDPWSATIFFGVVSSPAGSPLSLTGVVRRETNRSRTTALIPMSREVELPAWLRLGRAGSVFSLEASQDGKEWSTVGTREVGPGTGQIAIGEAVLAGLAVAMLETGETTRASFGDVSGPGFRGGPPAPAFRRGDADGTATIDLSDAIGILGFLFLGQEPPSCLDAADADDGGTLDLTDAIYLLQWLFLGGSPPADPGPAACGVDPTAELPDLGCAGPCP